MLPPFGNIEDNPGKARKISALSAFEKNRSSPYAAKALSSVESFISPDNNAAIDLGGTSNQ